MGINKHKNEKKGAALSKEIDCVLGVFSVLSQVGGSLFVSQVGRTEVERYCTRRTEVERRHWAQLLPRQEHHLEVQKRRCFKLLLGAAVRASSREDIGGQGPTVIRVLIHRDQQVLRWEGPSNRARAERIVSLDKASSGRFLLWNERKSPTNNPSYLITYRVFCT